MQAFAMSNTANHIKYMESINFSNKLQKNA